MQSDVKASDQALEETFQKRIEELHGKVKDGEGITLEDAVAARERTYNALQILNSLKEQVSAVLSGLTNDLGGINSSWQPKKQQHDKEYEAIMQLLAGKKEKADLILSLESELEQFKTDRESIQLNAQALSDSVGLFQQKAAIYRQLQLDNIQLTANSLADIESFSGGLARAELADTFDLQAIEEAIDNLCDKANIRTGKQELLDQIQSSDNSLEVWWAIIDEAINLLQWKGSISDVDENLPAVANLIAAFDESGLRRIASRLNQERINTMIRATAKPRPNIIQLRNGREIDFLQASQGERATTILTILMSQNSGPLLIDQPEEDLDNNVINDIVKATRSAKDNRQLIFATHNANLVVNGDAELVIDLMAGKIFSQGAIDSQAVRKSITKTMEGGKDAFELRRKKYNF